MTFVKKFFLLIVFIIVFILLFVLLKHLSVENVAVIKQSVPFWLFTILIAFIDSFNPCEIFIFLLLIGLLFSVSSSKFKVYLVGFVFIIVTFVFYFVFMATWLSIIQYVGLIDPVRILLGLLAIVVGLINCKDALFCQSGITLSVTAENKSKLYKKIRNLKSLLQHG